MLLELPASEIDSVVGASRTEISLSAAGTSIVAEITTELFGAALMTGACVAGTTDGIGGGS